MELTKSEICDYAEKYLGVDGGTVIFLDDVSEEICDGITAVTVRFFADYSKTVQSYFHI